MLRQRTTRYVPRPQLLLLTALVVCGACTATFTFNYCEARNACTATTRIRVARCLRFGLRHD
jgi:multisubunit Na+/H+ antiporter MnhC subunit